MSKKKKPTRPLLDVLARAVDPLPADVATEWRRPIYLDSNVVAPAAEGAVVLPPPDRTVTAGPHLRPVTAYQSELITRLNALRSSLWSLVARVSVSQPERSVTNTFRNIAADFSMASARAWKDHGFAGLAGEVHALEVRLETPISGVFAPDEWAVARRLAFDLAIEAGRIDHAAHVALGRAVPSETPAAARIASES